jgi:hypothetical protein
MSVCENHALALGQRWGSWRIVGLAHGLVLVVCLCGEVQELPEALVRAVTSSHYGGCSHPPRQMGRDMVLGATYGLLTLVGYAQTHRPRRGRAVLCQCVCGTVVSVRPNHLRTGHTTSCGCQRMTREKQRRKAQQLWGSVFAGRRVWHGGRPKKQHKEAA